MGRNNELVMGVPTHTLFETGFYFKGFVTRGPLVHYLMERIERSAAYRYRGDCETDIEFKQIIPYCLVTRGQETFVYRRKNGSDEKRLHAKFSVGIGGHINPEKKIFSTESAIQASMFREIAEEVEISADIEHDHSPKFIGMINWDDDEVGKVHLGLVYHIQLPEHTSVEIREKDKLEGSFQAVNEVCEIDNWENWSNLVVGAYLIPYLKRK